MNPTSQYMTLLYPSLVPLLQEFPPVTVTGALPNQCYSYARSSTVDSKSNSSAAYCEGFVFIHNQLPVGHAWYRSENGEYIDATNAKVDWARVGIEIPAKLFKKYMKKRRFAEEYEQYNDAFPFVRSYKRLYPDKDLAAMMPTTTPLS